MDEPVDNFEDPIIPPDDGDYDDDELAAMMNDEDYGEEDYGDEGGGFEEPMGDLAPAPSTLGSELQAAAKKQISKTEKIKKLDAKSKEIKKIESIKKTAQKSGNTKLMKEVAQVEQMAGEVDDFQDFDEQSDDLPYLDEGMDPSSIALDQEIRRKQEATAKAIGELASAVPLTIETVWTAAIEPRVPAISMKGLARTCNDNEDIKRDLQESFMDVLDELGVVHRDDLHNLPASTRFGLQLTRAMMITAGKNAQPSSKPLSNESKLLADQLDD
jgi:hypothetical protein